jgi:predicted nucleic acid-binding protein
MNVYIESNSVLELALLQEEHESCEGILAICENGKAQLVLPAFSIAEPYETLVRRDKSRNQLAQNVRTELGQLGRSKPYKTETDAFQAVVSLLVRSGEEEKQRLFQTRDRLLRVAEVIPLTKDILASAVLLQTKHGISPQDAIVYASVLQHLDLTSPAKCCFLNNDRDFSDPDIEDTLTRHGCKVLFSFSNGYNYIQRQI